MLELPPALHAILIWYLNGYTRNEIAKKLGISQGEVSARIKIMLESLAEGQDLALIRPLLKAIRKQRLTLANVAQAVYQNALLERLQMTAADLKKIDGVLSSIEQDPKLQGLSPLALLIQAVYLVADYTAKEGSDGNHPPLEELPAYFQGLRKDVSKLNREKKRIIKQVTDTLDQGATRQEVAKQNFGRILSRTAQASQDLKETPRCLEGMQTHEKAELVAISIVKDALSKGCQAAHIIDYVGILASMPKEELDALRAKYGSNPSESAANIQAKSVNTETPINEDHVSELFRNPPPAIEAGMIAFLRRTLGNPEWYERRTIFQELLDGKRPWPSTVSGASLQVECSQLGESKDVANDPAPREQPSDPSPYPANDKE